MVDTQKQNLTKNMKRKNKTIQDAKSNKQNNCWRWPREQKTHRKQKTINPKVHTLKCYKEKWNRKNKITRAYMRKIRNAQIEMQKLRQRTPFSKIVWSCLQKFFSNMFGHAFRKAVAISINIFKERTRHDFSGNAQDKVKVTLAQFQCHLRKALLYVCERPPEHVRARL